MTTQFDLVFLVHRREKEKDERRLSSKTKPLFY